MAAENNNFLKFIVLVKSYPASAGKSGTSASERARAEIISPADFLQEPNDRIHLEINIFPPSID